MDAGGEVGGELDQQSEGGGLDGGKAHSGPLVFGHRVVARGGDGLPVALIEVFDVPRGGQAAFAATVSSNQ